MSLWGKAGAVAGLGLRRGDHRGPRSRQPAPARNFRRFIGFFFPFSLPDVLFPAALLPGIPPRHQASALLRQGRVPRQDDIRRWPEVPHSRLTLIPEHATQNFS